MYKIQDSLQERKQKEIKSDLRFIVVIDVVVLFLLAVLFLNTYVFMNVRVEGSSMKPTLSDGDVLVANKIKQAERGDIIIIAGEKPDEWLIKRVIAMEGDEVSIIGKRVYINGEQLKEPYVIYPDIALTDPGEWINGYVLKQGEIFYLGDNRTPNASLDSRSYLGTCTEGQIVGVVEEWSLSLRPVLNSLSYVVGKLNERAIKS